MNFHKMERPSPHPDQEDIDKVLELLKEIRDILTEFISNDFQRLAQSLITQGIVNVNYFNDFKNTYIPIINQRAYEMHGYIEAHRYDPDFKEKVRSCGFFRPEVDIKKERLSGLRSFFSRFKNGPTRLALRCARVLFEEADTILESLAGFVPGLHGLIEIKKHVHNGVSAAEVASDAASGPQ